MPVHIMPKKCEMLGFPQQLSEDAQRVVEKIHREGKLEGCQPSTIVGVSLYLLNSRLHLNQKYIKYHCNDQAIAEAVGIGIQTIKQQAERVRNSEIYVMPEEYLTKEEKRQIATHDQIAEQQSKIEAQRQEEQLRHQQQEEQRVKTEQIKLYKEQQKLKELKRLQAGQ